MASYAELSALPAEAYLDPTRFITSYPLDRVFFRTGAAEGDEAEKRWIKQYKKGASYGKDDDVFLSEKGVWSVSHGPHGKGGVTTSYEGIGYHAATAPLLQGFLDSGASVFVRRGSPWDDNMTVTRITVLPKQSGLDHAFLAPHRAKVLVDRENWKALKAAPPVVQVLADKYLESKKNPRRARKNALMEDPNYPPVLWIARIPQWHFHHQGYANSLQEAVEHASGRMHVENPYARVRTDGKPTFEREPSGVLLGHREHSIWFDGRKIGTLSLWHRLDDLEILAQALKNPKKRKKKRKKKPPKRQNVIAEQMILRRMDTGGAGYHEPSRKQKTRAGRRKAKQKGYDTENNPRPGRLLWEEIVGSSRPRAVFYRTFHRGREYQMSLKYRSRGGGWSARLVAVPSDSHKHQVVGEVHKKGLTTKRAAKKAAFLWAETQLLDPLEILADALKNPQKKYGSVPSIGRAKEAIRKQGRYTSIEFTREANGKHGPVLVFYAVQGGDRYVFNVGRLARTDDLEVRWRRL